MLLFEVANDVYSSQGEGVLYNLFANPVEEGEGDRILRYWKLLLVPFKSSGHRNYGKEAVNLSSISIPICFFRKTENAVAQMYHLQKFRREGSPYKQLRMYANLLRNRLHHNSKEISIFTHHLEKTSAKL